MPIAESRLEILQVHKLLQCVRHEDKEQIEKLCSNGVPHLVNYSEPTNGETALHLAAINNNEDMVRYLLDLGAHPNVVDLKGRTAAMKATEYGHVQTLEVLATSGSDMKLRDTEGKDILFYCLTPTSRHSKCASIVLECGADSNNKNINGDPVFLVACETAAENENICLSLLEKGADANSKNMNTKRTALISAAGSGSVVVVRAILQAGGQVDAEDREKLTAVHLAAGGGHFEVLKVLASYGANFDVLSVIGNTPVHQAAKGGHAMCCKYLGQRGCKANQKNNDGQLPSQVAKDNDSKDAMKECKKVERMWKKIMGGGKPPVDTWAITMYDWTIEHADKLKQRFETTDIDNNSEPTGKVSKDEFCEILQSQNAPLTDEQLKQLCQAHDKNRENEIDYEEFFSGKKYLAKAYLMTAFEKKEKKKKGGKKGKKKKGKTKVPMPICTAPDGPRTDGGGPPEHLIGRHVPFSDTGRFDRDHPPEHPIQDDSIWYLAPPEKAYMNINNAAKMGDVESLKRAFWEGRNVDTRDKYFKTPLMVACHYGNFEMVQFLVENGADVNAKDNFKWTALHHACHAGQMDIVEMLVERGAEIEVKAMNGGTPLMRAVQSSRPDVVQYLIDKGAKVQQENRKGDNVMDIAMWWADPRVLEIVKEKFDSLPKPKEGKGKKGGKKSAKGKRDAPRASSVPPLPKTSNLTQMPMGESSTPPPRRERKSSVLRAASAMAGGVEHMEDVTYTPIKAWTHQHSTSELIIKKEQRRKRFGDEVDFPDFMMPFSNNFMKKSKALGGVSSDDED